MTKLFGHNFSVISTCYGQTSASTEEVSTATTSGLPATTTLLSNQPPVWTETPLQDQLKKGLLENTAISMFIK